jgi:hypothetical protein
MRHFLSPTYALVLALVFSSCTHMVAVTHPSAQTVGSGAGRKSLATGDWPNVDISDVYTSDAAKRALLGASQWLARPKCQALFSEFKDQRGLPLTAKLGELETDPERYLRVVLFRDGAGSSTCKRHGILAFTTPGSRVIYLCGRDFERAWRRDAREVQATVIHEVLHTLGLGENPPSPGQITYRVQQLCWD